MIHYQNLHHEEGEPYLEVIGYKKDISAVKIFKYAF